MRKLDRLDERIRQRSAGLAPSLRQVANYINENRRLVLEQSALEIAAETGTSDASVIRAIQALGFDGLRDLKEKLRGFLGDDLSSADKMAATIEELDRDSDATVSFVLEGHIKSVEALGSERNRGAVAEAVRLLRQARQIGVFGINASGLLATYASRLFVRNGYSSYALNNTGISLAEQLLVMGEGDVLIMMIQRHAHGEGTTVAREAKRLGVPIILLTSSEESPFMAEAAATILVPRGHSGKFPLHSPVLVCLEMLVLAVAATEPNRSSSSMERVHGFQASIKSGVRRGGGV